MLFFRNILCSNEHQKNWEVNRPLSLHRRMKFHKIKGRNYGKNYDWKMKTPDILISLHSIRISKLPEKYFQQILSPSEPVLWLRSDMSASRLSATRFRSVAPLCITYESIFWWNLHKKDFEALQDSRIFFV